MRKNEHRIFKKFCLVKTSDLLITYYMYSDMSLNAEIIIAMDIKCYIILQVPRY